MTLYTVRVGGLDVLSTQPGPNNPGARRAAFIDACQQLQVAIDAGVHGLITTDGVDSDSYEIEVPRGQSAGAWIERPTTRLHPEQTQAAPVALVAPKGSGS